LSWSCGNTVQQSAPHALLGLWQPAADRPDPIALLQEQERRRLPWLLPIRHGRMARSVFGCYRGSAAVMAYDLGTAPHSGLEVQLCGDAHLANFGFYASPERRLLFDLNDFDETARGPFEWDLKRLAASLVIVARELQMPPTWQEKAASRCARTYRKAMRALAATPWLDVWHRQFASDTTIAAIKHTPLRRHLQAMAEQARKRDHAQAFRKHCERNADGDLQIRHAPPLIWRHRELPPAWTGDLPSWQWVTQTIDTYISHLEPEVQGLMRPFRLVDTALKAVGVGSVGTRSAIGLFLGPREDDILMLQSKQAEPSVLEPYTAGRTLEHHGQRVVHGQRLLQSACDRLLHWSSTPAGDSVYIRQLRDWKGAVELESLDPEGLVAYGRICAAALAKAHARSGDRLALASYIGEGRSFETAMLSYALAYADQAIADYQALLQAIASGRLDSTDVA
jgi:uncharacterized protein (DUF2252 family)